MAWYDLEQKEETKREYLARFKYKKIVLDQVSSFNDIVGKDLEQDVQYRLVTNMSFNAITVIQWVLDQYEIDELYIVVYRMNDKSFDYLNRIIDQDAIKMGIIVSTFFRANKRYERWAKELQILAEEKKNVNISFHNSHAKVFLTKTKCGKYIVFEGSGNLSHNERLEQYVFEDNKTVYEFHKNWIEDISRAK